MTLFVGSLFDDDRGRQRLINDFGESNVYFHGVCYNGDQKKSISVLKSMTGKDVKERVIICDVQTTLHDQVFKYVDKQKIIEMWKSYNLPILIKSDGKWELSGYTDEYTNLINKTKWGKELYIFHGVLANEYSIQQYNEYREQYGKDIRDKCTHCRVNPPSINNYTTTYGNCAKCSRFTCGNHLWNKNNSYICPKCWVR